MGLRWDMEWQAHNMWSRSLFLHMYSGRLHCLYHWGLFLSTVAAVIVVVVTRSAHISTIVSLEHHLYAFLSSRFFFFSHLPIPIPFAIICIGCCNQYEILDLQNMNEKILSICPKQWNNQRTRESWRENWCWKWNLYVSCKTTKQTTISNIKGNAERRPLVWRHK